MQIEQLLEENEQLRTEIRHLKKLKGKPKIRPNVTDQEDYEQDPPDPKVADQKEGCGTDNLPKNGSSSL